MIGSTNTDMVVKAKHLPQPGETIIGGDFFMNPGGKGANQAVAAARLGGDVLFIAKTGNDLFGKQSKQLFQAEGINTDFMVSDPHHPSGVALITVDKNAENCIVVASGANAYLLPEDIEPAFERIKKADFILMQLEIPLETVQYISSFAKTEGIKVILNPAPSQTLPQELLQNIFILTPNVTEAEMISGVKINSVDDAKVAGKIILNHGVAKVIITMGKDGAVIISHDMTEHVIGHSVDAIDTTAAGDVFNGALTVSLSEGNELQKAVNFACMAAAISVTRIGAQSSAPYRNEIII